MGSDDDFDPGVMSNGNGIKTSPKEAKKSGKKRMSVEKVYQKKSQLEHILLRPDTYIGSVQPITEKMWVVENKQIVSKTITYTPGLYKIYDEILVNAADHKQRDKNMSKIDIKIDQENNIISIENNGEGIPVVEHKDEKMLVPTLIFGHLLTSSNYNDEEEKVTGGRNGFGAKLTNVFSKKFMVETACKKYKSQNVEKRFKQEWSENMSKKKEPVLKDYFKDDFTRITFQPDLAKFNMEKLDDDTVGLLSRRAYDVAASAPGVKVTLNGEKVPVKNFKDYVDLFLKNQTDERGDPVKPVYEKCSERWEVAVAPSDNGFQQMSFVNSIATTKGGRHIEHVSKQIENCLTDTIKKKNKAGIQIKPHQIRNHMWIFVNCLIVNPTFDSQTKENMTLQQNKFGSKCGLSDKFGTQLSKSGIVESVLAWGKFKADQQLKSKQTGKKTNKLKGIAKLEDANDAGTRYSTECTLILTEGDSAKTLAVAGLGVIGRDKYGVYPLKGKVLNVREASHKQIMDNKEITEIVKILGLQYKKKYTSEEDLKTLRYGKLMIMTDQDQDGSHIKGLLINFIHYNWPELLKLRFLEEFITPIVKATKGSNSMSFFSLPEFFEWKAATDNWHTYKIKYYKGLGTSTSKEAKEYFSDMKRHRILFKHESGMDDFSIEMAFSKKEIEGRKKWLTNWMDECKRRKELGLPEIYLYEKDTKAVSYADFINKELILFSNLDNERSIPSVVDGFKPGQRKVMFTCLKRNDKREVKVAQLAGSVGEMSAYHHGEASLMGTIINLAQNYVGSNNINLLQPIGQFGTRLAGGKDHASPRYIFTQMSPLTRLIFNAYDDPLLEYLQEDNQRIEPRWYMPILPMVLVNGADGIGTGWMTRIPNYNPREIVSNLKRMLDGKDPKTMIPWFKNFKGTVEDIDSQRFVVSGEIAHIGDTKIEITELPIRTWTQSYKESVMEPMLNGSDKVQPIITDYKEYHTDKTVRFTVTMSADKLKAAECQKGLHTFFKLQSTISTSSMVLFDQNGCMKRYEDANDILKEFFELRLEYYQKRKDYLEGMLEAEALRLSNQARFILEKCDGTLTVENKKKKLMISELQRKNFDPDPVKKWKAAQLKKDQQDMLDGAGNNDDSDSDAEDDASDADYDYLLGMPLWSLTQERKEDLLKKKDDKHKELNVLRAKSKEDLWTSDLDEFLAKLDEVEAKERDEDAAGITSSKAGKKGGLGIGGKKGRTLKQEAMPTPEGIRVEPRIPAELRTKAAKAAAAKDKKENRVNRKLEKEIEDEKDEFDMMIDDKEHNRSLSEKLGFAAETAKPAKKAAAGAGKSKPKKKAGNPFDDSDEDGFSGSDMDGGFKADSDDDLSAPIIPREKSGRGAAAKKKYVESSDEDSEDDFKPSLTKKAKKAPVSADSDDDDFKMFDDASLSPKPKAEPEDSDSDFGPSPPKKASSPKKPAPKSKAAPAAKAADKKKTVRKLDSKKIAAEKDEFDLMLDGDSDGAKPAAKPAKAKKAPAKPKEDKKPKAAKKKAGKNPWDSDENGFGGGDSGSDDDFSAPIIPREKTGRARNAAKKKYVESSGDDSDFDDFMPAKNSKKAKRADSDDDFAMSD